MSCLEMIYLSSFKGDGLKAAHKGRVFAAVLLAAAFIIAVISALARSGGPPGASRPASRSRGFKHEVRGMEFVYPPGQQTGGGRR